MAVRRDGVPGDGTRHGLLTLTKATAYDKLISQIDHDVRGGLVDLGFMLIQMSDESAAQLSRGIAYATHRARETHGVHDVTMEAAKIQALLSIPATTSCTKAAETPGTRSRKEISTEGAVTVWISLYTRAMNRFCMATTHNLNGWKIIDLMKRRVRSQEV